MCDLLCGYIYIYIYKKKNNKVVMTGVGPKGTEEDSYSCVMDGWQER